MTHLDQFYTTSSVARDVTAIFFDTLYEQGIYYPGEIDIVIEPSAGTGVFLPYVAETKCHIVATDIEPHHSDVIQADFLRDDISHLIPEGSTSVIIGNPPFGKRAALATDFINRGFSYSDTIGFILPVQFEKYLTQKRIDDDASLVCSHLLPPDSFIFNKKSYSVRCVFQIWTKREIVDDIRIRTAPPTTHHDFHMGIYNAKPQAEKLFHQKWDFAVLRQGWGSFTPIIKDDYTELSRKKQWMFFSAHTPQTRERLLSIDYAALSKKNTSVRGFGKADVVAEYMRRWG